MNDPLSTCFGNRTSRAPAPGFLDLDDPIVAYEDTIVRDMMVVEELGYTYEPSKPTMQVLRKKGASVSQLVGEGLRGLYERNEEVMRKLFGRGLEVEGTSVEEQLRSVV